MMNKLLCHKTTDREVHKSTYSLVSCVELTADTLQLWNGLPDEIKKDPSFEQIRQKYEELGDSGDVNNAQNGDKRAKFTINNDPILVPNNEHEGFLIQDHENTELHISPQNRKKHEQAKRTRYYIKMSLLLGCWVFFTGVFLTHNEKEEIFKTTAVLPGDINNYTLGTLNAEAISVKINGPFLSARDERNLNSSEYDSADKMVVWLEGDEISQPWYITLSNNLNYNRGEMRYHIFQLNKTSYILKLRTTASSVTAFKLSFDLNPLDGSTGVLYAIILLFVLYVLIIFEIINRTMAALLVSTTSLAALALVGQRPSLPEVISWLDVETLLLLFSMMILVAIMAETGIFDFLAVFTFEVTKGKLWPLIFLLCIITAVLSTFLDNVTTVLLMSPVTIRLCEVMDLDPVPILMFMAIYSNIGGTATPVGDPPNVIVASNKAVINAGINFTNFTAHMSVGVVFIVLQTTLQIKYMYRDVNKLRLRVPREIQELHHQISIWRRAAESLPHLSNGVAVVREGLERKIDKLNKQLKNMVKERNKRACPKDTFKSTLVELKEKYKIRDKGLLIKSSVAIIFVVTVFFLHSIPELNRVSLAMTALLGAILLLLLADRMDIEPILHRVEWSTLLFFAALFVLMEALSKLGLILYIGGLMEQVILKVDESSRLAVALILIIWVSGTISAFVDNIPLTTMMVRVVVSIGTNPKLNLPMAPLIWALLYGACLGGNGTLIGASANVVCAGVAEQHGYKFTFTKFFKVGFPIMIGHLVVCSVYLLICHCVFEWH
ncbi:P protein-like [Pieris napi]|uniref:P protein-like n=1 Tax=Pieris napi TaxID=78633 RepID=UPI001FBB9A0B|nr:P protein-like [Pieris napi]